MQATSLHKHLQQSVSKWGSKVRNGVAVLLQNKATTVQRYSALRVSVAMIELCGSCWLINSKQTPLHHDQDITLFQLVVEITKVELSILLHDQLKGAESQAHDSLMDTAEATSKLSQVTFFINSNLSFFRKLGK